MTLDELNERAEELGIAGHAQLRASDYVLPGEQFELFTIEDVVVNPQGQVRLIIQAIYDTEEV